VPPDQRLAVISRGDGPRVVLLHGFTQTAHSWHAVAHEFKTDHEIVAIDLPGHGDSSNVRADLTKTADLVAETVGAGTYIGYSMGGRVALHLALSHPNVVKRLVLIGATAGIDDAGERDDRRCTDNALADFIETNGVDVFLDRWLAQPLFATLPPEAADRADRARNTAAGLASSLRLSGTGSQQSLWHRVNTLDIPVLVVAGEHDDKFTTLAHRLVTAVGPNATFASIEGAGHAAHLERPDAFIHAYRVWETANPIA
jgi:2-succinyl-6-hydroxy-2,4-cyclohexadiene-1-carboxylate synthase